jgi:transposase-like protein
VATTPPSALPVPVPNPEVVPKAKRRYITAAYKLDILREADACTTSGAIGALLRREGLYSSSLTEWRRMRDKGFLDAAVARKRGRKPKPVDPLAKKLVEVERELAKTKEKLRKAEIIIDFQKKVQDLLRMQEEGEKK